MSVIVWDGKKLAADRQATNGSLKRSMPKIWKYGDLMIAGVGTAINIEAMRNWIMGGLLPDKFPKLCETEGMSSVWLINKSGKIAKFEHAPYPIEYYDKVFCDGSGRDFAYGAMAMGADAVKAVEVASEYCCECGGGVDVLTFDE